MPLSIHPSQLTLEFQLFTVLLSYSGLPRELSLTVLRTRSPVADPGACDFLSPAPHPFLVLRTMGYTITHYPPHLRHMVPQGAPPGPVRLSKPRATEPSLDALLSAHMKPYCSPVTSESSLGASSHVGGGPAHGMNVAASRFGGSVVPIPRMASVEGEVVDLHVETASATVPPVSVALRNAGSAKGASGFDDVEQTRWDYSRVLQADKGMTRVYSSHSFSAVEEDGDSSDGEYVEFREDGRRAKKSVMGGFHATMKRTLSRNEGTGGDVGEGNGSNARGTSGASGSSFHFSRNLSNVERRKDPREKSFRRLPSMNFSGKLKVAKEDDEDGGFLRSLSRRNTKKSPESKLRRSMSLRRSDPDRDHEDSRQNALARGLSAMKVGIGSSKGRGKQMSGEENERRTSYDGSAGDGWDEEDENTEEFEAQMSRLPGKKSKILGGLRRGM